MSTWSRLARGIWWTLPAGLRDRLRVFLYATRRSRSRFGRAGVVPAPGVSPHVRPSVAAPTAFVSVVIPTLDAGPLFARVLATLHAQKGLEGLEIVVVDSGSTDRTVDLARASGATVLAVDRGAFGHGLARNLGAEHARGDVLVMLAQDAVLLGRTALASLVAELRADPALAAVSARQVPRSDADLYAAYVVLTHERVVVEAAGTAGGRPPGDLSAAQRRAVAAVDDVCAAIERDVWRELRFRDVPFAEDVDFGLRAIESGRRVTVSRSTAVAHSHTRDAVYALRRSAADRLCVAPLVGDRRTARAAACEPMDVLRGGRLLVDAVAGALDHARLGDAPLAEHLRAVRASLRRDGGAAPPTGELERLAEALPSNGASSRAGKASRLLADDLLALLGWPPLTTFARPHSSATHAEAATFVAKLSAAVIGTAAGDACRRSPDPATSEWLLDGI